MIREKNLLETDFKKNIMMDGDMMIDTRRCWIHEMFHPEVDSTY